MDFSPQLCYDALYEAFREVIPMKKHVLIPSLSAAGGIVCFLLRRMQLASGFEAGTGLPVAGEPLSVILPTVLAALFLAITALAWKLPDEKEDCPLDFGRQFAAARPTLLLPAAAGIGLWLLSGAARLAAFLQAKASGLHYTADLRMGALTGSLVLAAALCLLPALDAARRGRDIRPGAEILLVLVVSLVAQLALGYREMSVNASQQAYYPALMALMALTVCFFRLSSFAFRCGKTRRFVIFSAAAVLLCMTAAADPAAPAVRLVFPGGAAVALGFQSLRLAAYAQNHNEK